MLLFNKKIMMYCLPVSFLFSFLPFNPLIYVFFQSFFVYILFLKHIEQKNNCGIANNTRIHEELSTTQDTTSDPPYQNKRKSFVQLIPIVSFPQKKVAFYSCSIYHPHRFFATDAKIPQKDEIEQDFFECLKFLSQELNLEKNIRYMLDLPSIILNDNTYFDLFEYQLQARTIKNENIIFNLDYRHINLYVQRIMQLVAFGVNFNVYNLTIEHIEPLLKGPLSKSIFTCQISQSQLLNLMRDELMNERIFHFQENTNGYISRLLVNGVEDLKELESLPHIVDFVSGKFFSKPITVAI